MAHIDAEIVRLQESISEQLERLGQLQSSQRQAVEESQLVCTQVTTRVYTGNNTCVHR
jgi:hypothetical protein